MPYSCTCVCAGRSVETDHGAFMLLNCYVPNAGGAREGRPRAQFKLRFLQVPSPLPQVHARRCSRLQCTIGLASACVRGAAFLGPRAHDTFA